MKTPKTAAGEKGVRPSMTPPPRQPAPVVAPVVPPAPATKQAAGAGKKPLGKPRR